MEPVLMCLSVLQLNEICTCLRRGSYCYVQWSLAVAFKLRANCVFWANTAVLTAHVSGFGVQRYNAQPILSSATNAHWPTLLVVQLGCYKHTVLCPTDRFFCPLCSKKNVPSCPSQTRKNEQSIENHFSFLSQ